MIEEYIIKVVQALLLILISPLMTGLIRKFKSMMQGKVGPSIFQPYRDLKKLFSKSRLSGDNHTWLFRAVPYLCMASMIVLAFMIPFVFVGVLSPFGDLIALVYIFTLFRFAMVLGGLEGGSVFGGMGSSREMMMSVLIEPALLLSIMALSVLTGGSTNMSDMSLEICNMGINALGPTIILAVTSFMMTLLAENARVPFDNPATHLELTMVHEAMILEYSGKKLGLMEFSSQIRLTLFMAMVCSMFLPWGIATELTAGSLLIALGVVAVKMIVLALAIAVIECITAKYRLFKTPILLTISFILSVLAMISVYIL